MPASVPPRRALAAVVTAAALALAGCASRPETTGSGPLVLGFVNGADTEFHTCLQKAVEQTAKAEGVQVVTANSAQNPATERTNVEDMIGRKVDALIVQTVSFDGLVGDIAAAGDAHVPIFLTSVVPDDTTGILGAAVVDLQKVGALDAGWIGTDAHGRQVQVAVISGSPGAASTLLVNGFMAALPSNARVVANKRAMFNPTTARAVAADMIKAYPGLGYAFVANEGMALAARTAFDAAGAENVRIVTVNGTDAGLAAVKDGRLSATVSNSALSTGELAVHRVLDLLAGEKTEPIVQSPVLLVTKENVAQAPRYCP
ncbi:ribose import binding protein RbsB [Kitasatospora sp. NE20-6]|uniref:sugar ABC transporter substrate-binding protein n=1 Tax=Kitasatospora sp. NE20-6 TaxID=2859066 RepID=UPI0034DC93A8